MASRIEFAKKSTACKIELIGRHNHKKHRSDGVRGREMTTPPKDGDLKDCEKCGEPAEFKNRPLKPSMQPFQIGDYVPPLAEYEATPGWSCTVCDHFIRELLEPHSYERDKIGRASCRER